MNQGDYSGASTTFSTVPGFRDADSRVTSALEDGYKAAAAKEEAGELDEANAIFLNLGDYKDSADRAYKLYYDAGIARREAKDWDGARAAFTKAGSYSDAPEQIKETAYQEASALEVTGDQEGAYKLFISLGKYKDSYERANKPYYDLGVQKMNAGEWIAAITAFSHAGEYNDAAERTQAAYYSQGETLRNAEDWGGAVTAFTNAGEYSDAVMQVKVTYYTEGVAKQKTEDWDGAIIAFTNAEDYNDAAIQIRETKYMHARSLMTAGYYDESYQILINLKGYKDVDSLLENDKNLVAIAAIVRAEKLKPFQTVGSYVSFGSYTQTSGGTDRTPITWYVLDYDEANHRVLLLSKYGLDAKSYNNVDTDITWEKCTLRAWLNSNFLNNAFSSEEQSAILITDVDNSLAQGFDPWNTSGGNNTQDRIFLLSYAEAHRYLGVIFSRDRSNEKKPRVAPTPYAIKKGAVQSANKRETSDGNITAVWWLRSPYYNLDCAACVDFDGSLSYRGVDWNSTCVRPAFWLNLESDLF